MASCVEFFLSDFSVLDVNGPDAASFLQGQFSNDLSKMASGEVVYGLWLSLKGKILADSFILKRGEGAYLIVCYKERCGEIRDWLDGRLFMDEVELGEVRKIRSASVWGSKSLGALFDDRIPLLGKFEETESVLMFWGRRDSVDVLEVLDLNGSGEVFRAVLAAGTEIEEKEIAIRAIRSKVYSVGSDILEDLPQEARLDEIGVSYTKGCYVGQEVMARLKAMGRARRILETVILSEAPSGESPWKLLDTNEKKAGELRRFVASEAGILGSAMIRFGADVGPYQVSDQNISASIREDES